MIIIIGLGNPGEKLKKTRHNVGFMAIDEFARKNNFPDFNLQKKSISLISEKDRVFLVKPQTFMNDSGKAVKEILKNNSATNLVVVHDDIDLPVGKIKIVKDRGSAGHKGVESIIKNIGNENFIRIRIGIKPQQYHRSVRGTKKAKDVVLKNFSPNEQKTINEATQKIADALELFVKDGLEKTMNKFN